VFERLERYICYNLDERIVGDKENKQTDATKFKLLSLQSYLEIFRALIYGLILPKLGKTIARNLESTKI
jgi:hypothetical protein